MPICGFCGKYFEYGDQHSCFGKRKLLQKENSEDFSNSGENRKANLEVDIYNKQTSNEIIDASRDILNEKFEKDEKSKEIASEEKRDSPEINSEEQRERTEDTMNRKKWYQPINYEQIGILSDLTSEKTEDGKSREIKYEKKRASPEASYEKPKEQKEGTIDRKKWYIVGIGGAGCNLVDSILARKHYLNEVDKNGYLNKVWEMAVQDFKLFDTNTTGIISSFTAKTKGWNEAKILSKCQLGGKDGTVGGGCDRLEGERAMEQTIISKNMRDFKLMKEGIRKINESQAVLLMHSTTKGTGCGAAPVFAKYLKEEIIEDAKNKMIISFTVLPDEEDIDSGIVGGNAFIGLGKIVHSVDAVFLCDNQALFKIPFGNVGHEYLEKSVPFMWKRNRHIVEFIEALSLQSSWANDEDPAGFDLMDAIHPARMSQENQDHAPILIPAIGSVGYSGKVNAQIVKNLFINTLMGGKLAQCDYKKVKGASFVIYGPREAMETLEDLKGSEVSVMKIARSFLDIENEQKNISIFYTTRKHLTKLHMLGLLWNPPLKAVDLMEKRVDGCINSTPALRDEPSVKEAVKLAREVHKDLGCFFGEK